jgi:long-subunit fatty acid transport protein
MAAMKRVPDLALWLIVLLSTPARASLEKSTAWSGRYAAMAGATTAAGEGSQAIFFNPAGMAGREGFETTLNLSPTWVSYKGPVVLSNEVLSAENAVAPYLSLTTSYGISPRWTIGAGFATLGGSRAKYSSLDYSGYAGKNFEMRPDLKSELTILEATFGTAYELLPGLKLGAAWRTSWLQGNLSLPTVVDRVAGNTTASDGLLALDLTELSAKRYNGFRLGAQYAPEDQDWGVGASWRTPVDFLATGSGSGRFESELGGTVKDLTGGGQGAELTLSLPSRIALGGSYRLRPQSLLLVVDAIWTEYARDRSLGIRGTLPTGVPAQEVALNWRNIWSFRFGAEYSGIERWRLRAGYLVSTQGTPNDTARATGVAPGVAQGFALGAGLELLNSLSLDGCLEYSGSSGPGEAPALLGDYSSTAFAVHLGTTLRL